MNLKNGKCAHLEFKTHYQTLKSIVIRISEVHILIQHLLKPFLQKKLSYKQKQLGQLNKKRLKMVI